MTKRRSVKFNEVSSFYRPSGLRIRRKRMVARLNMIRNQIDRFLYRKLVGSQGWGRIIYKPGKGRGLRLRICWLLQKSFLAGGERRRGFYRFSYRLGRAVGFGLACGLILYGLIPGTAPRPESLPSPLIAQMAAAGRITGDGWREPPRVTQNPVEDKQVVFPKKPFVVRETSAGSPSAPLPARFRSVDDSNHAVKKRPSDASTLQPGNGYSRKLTRYEINSRWRQYNEKHLRDPYRGYPMTPRGVSKTHELNRVDDKIRDLNRDLDTAQRVWKRRNKRLPGFQAFPKRHDLTRQRVLDIQDRIRREKVRLKELEKDIRHETDQYLPLTRRGAARDRRKGSGS